MAIKPDYDVGTVTIAALGSVATFAGGANLVTADIQPGDTFKVKNLDAIITAVTATTITLKEAWTGGALTASAYAIRYQPDGSRFTAALRALVASISTGSLAALQAITGAANKIPYFTGPGAMSTVDLPVSGVLGDVVGPTASVVGGVALMGGTTGRLLQDSSTKTGKFWSPDGARIARANDRMFVDAAATSFDGTKNEAGSYVAGSPAFSGYVDRAASFAAYSSVGGVGGAFATRASDQYTTFPSHYPGAVPTPWIASGSAVLNSRRAYQGRVYTVTSAGTFSTTPPTHTTGSATNGTATLQFIDFTYMVPIGVSAFGIQDSDDTGTAVWTYYGETVTTGNSPSYIGEFNAKNKTAFNPVNGPYNRFALSMGFGLAAGGDSATGGAATNPSSSAILIYRNSHTWNTGIVFDAIGITGTDGITGFGIALKFARGHVQQWQYAGNNVGFEFVSTVDAANSKQTLSIDNNGASFLNNSNLANFQVGQTAGTITGYIAALADTGSSPSPSIQAKGTATNVSVRFIPQGNGVVYTPAMWAGNADGSYGGKLQTRGSSGGSYFSVAWTGSALNFYIDTTLVKTL